MAGAPPRQPGTCNGAPPAAPPEEGEPPMHVRMCKKIAQLTKVIYALNMKNDEHEASIQALKETHQEEIQHILVEMREAVLHYKRKVEEEQDLQQRIRTLEEALEQHRQLKGEALTEFAPFRKREDKTEPQSVERGGAKEGISLPLKRLSMKLDSEKGARTSNQESGGFLNEQERFEGEIRTIEGNVDEKSGVEMRTLVRELETLQQENQKLAEEYAKKASQLQASHERDRETWRKATQPSRADSCQGWLQREDCEAASQQQMRKMEADLETKGQRIAELKKHSQKLKEAMQDLELQLKVARQANAESKRTMKTLEEELSFAKERLLMQENGLLQKTEAMETALNSQSKTRDEAGDLRKQILHLRQPLPSKQSPRGRDLNPRRSASRETEALTVQHREELCRIRHASEEEKVLLKEQLVTGLEDLAKKHALELKAAQVAMDAHRKKLQKEVQEQLEELKKKHENEIRQLQREKDALHGKLQDCSQEVLRLEDFIKQNRDIDKYGEFLKYLARKPCEQQQESQDASVQPKNVSKQCKGRTKGRDHLAAPSSTRSEEKRSEMNATPSRSDSGGPPKREGERSLASFQKEKAKEIQALQEEWSYQKADLQAQVAQLKRALEQQAETFQEALQEQHLQSGQEKEKLLQNLQDTIQQSQGIKAQLEASHQTAINLLEKSKNQELKEAEERWKKEMHESFKIQQESYWQEGQTLEEKAKGGLQGEQEKIRQRQSGLIESLRTELAEQQASCLIHQKERDEFQKELRNMMALKRQQEEDHQEQTRSLRGELVKCQNEIGGLKKENSLLKDTGDVLRTDAAPEKQASAQFQEPEGQHRRFKELEETPRKRESRPEDLHLISCLQEKLNEKEGMIKELMDRKLPPSFIPSAEPHRNRSFSFNTNPSTCLAPIAKQKKKMDDMPSRIVSVPNLASYAKSFLSGELRPKRNPPQITKSTSLDQNPGCVRVCYPPAQMQETNPGPRLQSNEMAKPKEALKQDSGPQEWFTKYFSF